MKETAAELTNLQAQLADFNLLVDKMNTDTEVLLVQQEAQELASQNESDSRDVDGIFAEKQARMDQIHRLEQEVYISIDSFILWWIEFYPKPEFRAVIGYFETWII